MKILLVDRPFPTNIAQWRIEEAKSFIKMGADVMSIGSKDETHAEMCDYYGLNDHNILIFDRKWNHLNKYNKGFDGITGFNNRYHGDYVYTKDKTFNIKKYDIIYSCFYSRWRDFNALYDFPQGKQVIHLYPGGEFIKSSVIHKSANIITTQKYYTDRLREMGHTKLIEVVGASHLQKDSTFTPRQINTGKIKICFSSAVKQKTDGIFKTLKGADVYVEAVDKYKKLYKHDNVEFMSVGYCPDTVNITHHNILPMESLKKLYDTVDIYVNSEKGLFQSGWPLGIEACLRGSTLITTDPFNAIEYHPTFKDKVIIVDINNSDQIVHHIKRLYDDRVLLNKLSVELQKATHEFYSFENQQQKIFNFIEEVYNDNKRTS